MKKRKSGVIARVESKHRKGCNSVSAVRRGDWNTPWASFPPKGEPAAVWLSSHGTASGRSRDVWLRFVCNDTECRATVVVRGDACCRLAPVGSEYKRVPSPTGGTGGDTP